MTPEEIKKYTKLEQFFNEATQADSWKNFMTNGTKAFRYKESDQWTNAELSELNKRKQPPYVNNQVKVTIDRLTGSFSQQKTRIAFQPRTPEDQETADLLTDVFRYIYQNNGLEFHERECAEDGFTCGRGILEVGVDFDDNYQPQIVVQAVDVWSVHPDPKSKAYDWNEDALYICRSKWIDTDEVVELYPHKAMELKNLRYADPVGGVLADADNLTKPELNYVDTERNRLRLVEVQYKEKFKETIYLTPDNQVVRDVRPSEAKKQGFYPIDRIGFKMRTGVFTQGILLEDEETEKRRFSFIQYLVHRKKSGEPYSMVLAGLPLQDSINKRGSKALHLLNTNQTLFETNALINPAKFAEEKAKPDGMLEVKDGALGGNRITMLGQENRALAREQMEFHDSDLANFRRVTGVNPDALGEKSEIRSGIGIARKVAQTETVVAGAFDNFRRTRLSLAHTVLDCIQRYYTPRKLQLITDRAEAPKFLNLDEYSLEAIKQRQYDVVVDEMPDLVNVEEEQYTQLTQILPQLIQTGPFWLRMLLKLSKLRDKDEIIKQLDSLPKGPAIQPKLNITAQIDALGPVEKAYLYQQMGAEEVAQAIVQENAPRAQDRELMAEKIKLQGEMAKIQAEMQQTQLEAQAEQESAQLQAEVERQKAEAEVVQAKIDIVMAQLELEKKRLEIEKAEVDVRNKKAQASQKRKESDGG